jgi:ankyrin repeat protein
VKLKYPSWRCILVSWALPTLLSGCGLNQLLNTPAPLQMELTCLNQAINTESDRISEQELQLIRLIKNQDHLALATLLQQNPNLLENNPTQISPLHIAAYFGNLPALKSILEKGAKIDNANCRGNTPLHFAAFALQAEAVAYLLAQGANPKAANQTGDTPLHFASGVPVEWLLLSMQSDVPLSLIALPDKLRSELRQSRPNYAEIKQEQRQIIAAFLQKGVPVDIKNNEERTPLFYAAMSKDIEAFRQLNLSDGYILFKDRSTGQSLIHQLALGPLPLDVWLNPPKDLSKFADASIYQSSEKREQPLISLIHEMIQLDLPFDEADNSGNRPLHFAAKTGQENILALLLRAGAKVNASNDKQDPLALACYIGDLPTIQRLVEAGAQLNLVLDKTHALANAAAQGHENVVRYLIERGYLIEFQGVSALNAAVAANQESMVKFLLQSGAQPNYISFLQTPLQSAFAAKNLRMVQLLLDAGADPKGMDLSGNTAWAALEKNNSIIQEFLLGKDRPSLDTVSFFKQLPFKPNLSAQNAQGETLLHTWLKANQAVSLLNAAGPLSASINLPNSAGNTALQEAILKNNLDWVKALLAQKADLNWANLKGETALDLAIANGDKRIVPYLAGLPGQHWGFRLHRSAYLQALKNHHLVSVQELIKQSDWDPQYQDSTGKTIWGYFFDGQSRPMTDNALLLLPLLLEAGLPPNQLLGPLQVTPLYWMAENNLLNGAQELLAKGADPNFMIPHNQEKRVRGTSLHSAVQQASQALINSLLEAKANPQLQDGYGKTVLHHCVRKGQIETLQKSLDLGWSLAVLDWQGRGLLWEALNADQMALIPILLAQIPESQLLKDLSLVKDLSPAEIQLVEKQPALKNFLQTPGRSPL